jgi:hypothetical protein
VSNAVALSVYVLSKAALLIGLDLPLPKTRAIADEAAIDTIDVMADFQPVTRAAITELQETASSLLQPSGHGLGTSR